MKDLFAQKKRERCPQCLSISLERDQTSNRVCRHPSCGWMGSREEGQAKWDELRALKATAYHEPTPNPVHQPPEVSSTESPRVDLKPRPNESPRERQLAARALNERLAELRMRPINPGADNARVLTAEEIAQRGSVRTISQEERQRDASYRRIAQRAGITPAGIVMTPDMARGRGFRG